VAEEGHADAMFNLGWLLQDRGDLQSMAEAERWYQAAADAGHARAKERLARLQDS